MKNMKNILSIVCNKKWKNMKVFLISLICFFTICANNTVIAENSCGDDIYEYWKTGGRTNKKDCDFPDGLIGASERSTIDDTLKVILQAIPGFNSLVLTLEFVAKVMDVANLDEIKNITDVLTKMLTIGANILDPKVADKTANDMSIVVQSTFGVNLYCSQQKIYEEETNLLSKSAEPKESGSNYSMFPVYPLDISVNSWTGQCEVTDSVLNNNFYISSVDELSAMDTKCSYAYSASDRQCLEDYGLPYFVTAVLLTEGANFACDPAGSTGGMPVPLYISIPIMLAQTASELFSNEKLILDPISLIDLSVIEMVTFWFVKDYIMQTSHNKCTPWILLGSGAASQVLKLDFTIRKGNAHEKAKEAIKKYTFCGYDWLSYTKTQDNKYWKRGMYDHSYYKVVSDCIRGEANSTCNVANSVACSDPADPSFCAGVTATSADIRNKLFREFVYGGKEYTAGRVEASIKDGDNRKQAIFYNYSACIDPRLPDLKGYNDVEQRYYMKGNDKANFACNRFYYDRNGGCVLRDTDIDEEDKLALEVISSSNVAYYLVPSYNKVLVNKYSKKCDNVFMEARECCKHRSKHLICLENKTTGANTFCMANVIDGEEDNKEMLNMTHFLKNLNPDLNKVTCEIDDVKFEAGKKKGTEHVCVFSHGFCPYNFKLNAGLNYRASYCDADYFTDYSDNAGVLRRGRTHYNVSDCKQGLFGADYREEYKDYFGSNSRAAAAYTFSKVADDMAGYNNRDFETIYDFSKLTDMISETADDDEVKWRQIEEFMNCGDRKTCNTMISNMKNYGYKKIDVADSLPGMFSSGTTVVERYSINEGLAQQVKTSAYKQVKNFCQYRAHCVEVEAERESTYLYALNSSLFLDPSCGGDSNNSRHILQAYGLGISKQLSAPIVECIFESLKNLINGVAGNSLCDEGYERNNEGYCGLDTKEDVEKNLGANNRLFFEGKYQKYEDKYVIKGYSMPDSNNPFLILQKNLLNVIRAALSVFLVVFFYKQLITGKINSFVKADNMPKLVATVFKFVIVTYLIFNNGWQKGIYERLVNFSTSGYTFVNRIFAKIVKNPTNQIMNLDGGIILGVKSDMYNYFDIANANLNILCYRYDIMNNIDYAIIDPLREYACPVGFIKSHTNQIAIKKESDITGEDNNRLVISNNQEISRLLYFIDTYNKTKQSSEKLELVRLDSNGVELWNSKYDGCYFDVTEYPDGKGYLAVFDMFDCKLANYIGFGIDKGVPNLLIYSAIMLFPSMIFPDIGILKLVNSALTFVGSILFGALLAFMFIMFNIMTKVVYLFTSSFFTLSLLVFVSPIVLPLMFFERTKKNYEVWLESIVDTIFRPLMAVGFIVLYINLLDKMLLTDVIFRKHNKVGRGAIMQCPDTTEHFTFICFITKVPIIGQIIELFQFGILQVFFNIVIAFLLFSMADSFLNELETISNQLFKFYSDDKKSSSSLVKADFSEKSSTSISGATTRAMEAGKDINKFRKDYINKVPGYVAGKIDNKMQKLADKADSKLLSSVSEAGPHKKSLVGKAAGFYLKARTLGEKIDNKTSNLYTRFTDKLAQAKNRVTNIFSFEERLAKREEGLELAKKKKLEKSLAVMEKDATVDKKKVERVKRDLSKVDKKIEAIRDKIYAIKSKYGDNLYYRADSITEADLIKVETPEHKVTKTSSKPSDDISSPDKPPKPHKDSHKSSHPSNDKKEEEEKDSDNVEEEEVGDGKGTPEEQKSKKTKGAKSKSTARTGPKPVAPKRPNVPPAQAQAKSKTPIKPAPANTPPVAKSQQPAAVTDTSKPEEQHSDKKESSGSTEEADTVERTEHVSPPHSHPKKGSKKEEEEVSEGEDGSESEENSDEDMI
jgi:type IV secretory pathway VirB6-like protein